MGKNDTGMMGFASTFAAAQTAIIMGAGISYPFDTVRRRLQMQAEKPVEQHIYKGTADCLKKIAAEEGVAAGPTRGSLPTRSAVSAERWCWCSTTEPRRTWASAARVAASKLCGEHTRFLGSLSSKSVGKRRNGSRWNERRFVISCNSRAPSVG